MNELEQRVKTLEEKVKILEETLETLKNMNLSEQMDSYVQSKSRSLKMVDLLNSISEEPSIDFNKERETLNSIQKAKRTVDSQIAQAVRNAGTFSEDYPDDPRCFSYEIENGMISGWNGKKEACQAIISLAGKGIRITGFNGFETKRIIVPREIDGLPVVSIGEKAFINAHMSDLILPKTIKCLHKEAFSGCTNLKSIDLPEGVAFIGEYCFYDSGLIEVALPNSLLEVSSLCFRSCKNLAKIVFGNNLKKIDYGAFDGCKQLNTLSLPETLKEIAPTAFVDTSISTLIIPENVEEVSGELFKSYYSAHKPVTCVFLGMNTRITGNCFTYITMIYCLPGSAVQKFAREHKIAMRSLSEFRMEDYQ